MALYRASRRPCVQRVDGDLRSMHIKPGDDRHQGLLRVPAIAYRANDRVEPKGPEFMPPLRERRQLQTAKTAGQHRSVRAGARVGPCGNERSGPRRSFLWRWLPQDGMRIATAGRLARGGLTAVFVLVLAGTVASLTSAVFVLARDGWRAIDDVNTGRGNIDHTLLGSGGVLSIEPVGGMFCV
jgi:hypothetical protein